MAGIKYLYNEARNPRPDLTTAQLAQIMSRTFDVLDSNLFWANNGNFLYPTGLLSTTVLIGATTTDLSLGLGGNLVVTGFVILISSTVNASVFALSISPGISCNISSSNTKSGVILPIAIGLPIETARFTTIGAFFVGLKSQDSFNLAGFIVSTGAVAVVSAPANASVISMSINPGVATGFSSGISGAGTPLPLNITMNGTEAMRILVNRNVLMNRTTDDTSAATLQVSANSGNFAFSCTGSADNTSRFNIFVSGGVATCAANGATAVPNGETITTGGGARFIRAGIITQT